MAWFGNSEAHARAGRLGGKAQGKRNNPSNWANDREGAARAGKKGGLHKPSNPIKLKEGETVKL